MTFFPTTLRTAKTMLNLKRPTDKQSEGSALLLTLIVVSLMLVVVLSFVVFVRMELRNITARQELALARANARLGANLAISKLQELAGPDTRVTTPILSPAIPNNAYVGQVFDASAYRPDGSGGLAFNPDFTQNIGYFISGDTFDPDTYNPYNPDGTVDNDHAILVGPGSVNDLEDYIAAPLEILPNNMGSYAWWASDEGLKAQINIVDSLDDLVATGELTASEATLARKATGQRSGSEVVLENYDPNTSLHKSILERASNLEQVNLWPGVPLSTGLATDSFHDVTMRSEGIFTNTRRGGLMRDLMAVMKEAESNGGNVTTFDDSGPESTWNQWTKLLKFQESRIDRWGDETDVLEAYLGKEHHLIIPSDRPAVLPERHWNALQAFTLRTGGTDPQNDPDLADRIFPPLSDMHTRFDQGGAGWEQLMTWTTLKDRRETGGSIEARNRWSGETMELSPVIARINISAYATLDYPDAALHFVPVVVLWNPYDVPIRMKSNTAEAWRVVINFPRTFAGAYTHNYWFRVRASHPSWTINPQTSGSRFNHIPGRNRLWTPRFMFIWQGLNDNQFSFDLRDASGGTDVVIGPGQARIFTMHDSHVDLTPNDPAYGYTEIDVDHTVILKEGENPHPDGGHFSMYRRVNLKDQMDNPVREARPSVNEADDIGRNPGPGIRVGYEAGGGVSMWHAIGGGYAAKPYPFPLDPSVFEHRDGTAFDPLDSRWLYNGGGGIVPQPIPPSSICVNVNYFDDGGWEFHEIGLEFGRDGQGGNESLGDITVRLQEGEITDMNTQYGKVLQDVIRPYNSLPTSMSANAGSVHDYDGNPYQGEPPTVPVFGANPRPADDKPLLPGSVGDGDPDTVDGFPAWGMTWALRLPQNAFKIDFDLGENIGGTGEDAETADYLLQETRWIQDFNPTSPFVTRDPSSSSSFGFSAPATHISGYFIGSQRYGELDWISPDGMNQFIGHTDDTLGGTAAVLYGIPDSPDEIVSVASLSQAPLIPTKHSRSVVPTSIPKRTIWSNNRSAIPYEMAFSRVNYGYIQPVNLIGGSRSHLMVERDMAVQSFFPNDFFTTPRDTVPYGASKNPNDWNANGQTFQKGQYSPPESYMPAYDTNWVYNEALWDDFFFSSKLNTRYVWLNGKTPLDRDVDESAENLLISGAFNINSTSIPAWATLISSFMGLETVNSTPVAPIMRSVNPIGDAFVPDDHVFEVGGIKGFEEETFTGYRRLTEAEILDLATEIVQQVEARGPFLSLSDFVNRALVDSSTDVDGLGLAGALQAAIDATDLNDSLGDETDPSLWIEGETEYVAPVTAYAMVNNAFASLNGENVEGRMGAGIAAELNQADLLSRLGTVMRPRSDTFKLRVQGILGNANAPNAKAWCEVIIQRSTDYVDDQNNQPSDLPADLTATNLLFGRRFRIVSFRWLTEDEI